MGDALPAVDLGSRDGVPLKATTIAALDYHSFCAILDDPDPDTSAVKCWGDNVYCELGTGTTEADLAASTATTGDHLPWVDLGVTTTGQKRRATAIAGGFQFVCVLGDDGAVLCWGDNLSGQLGLGFTSAPRSCMPTEIGDAARVPLPAAAVAIGARGASNAGAHACALLETGVLTCWGENTIGQLGTGDTVTRSSPSSPLVFADPFSPARLVLGDRHTCAISTDKRIKCWGSNQEGQLGPSASSGLDEPEGDTVLQGLPVEALAAGSDHTCAVLTGGALKCWGRNLEGQLGVGDRTNRGDQPAQMGSALPAVDLGGIAVTGVAAGASHTCALLASGAVKCWGDNSFGQLGTGDATALQTPRSAPIALGASASAVAAGAAFTCALLEKGAVACWGDNANGQLGTGDMVSRLAPAGAVAGLVSPALAIAAGDAHACVLLDHGQIACWGANGSGQLGTGDLTDRSRPTLVNLGKAGAKAISAAGRETCAMLQTGEVKCWGENGSGQLGDGDIANLLVSPTSPIDLGLGRTASTLSVGGAFACAVLDTGDAKCWGDNSSAELGTSFTASSIGSEPGQLGDALPTVVVGGGRSIESLATGRAHACAVLDTHDVHCWGDNSFGQLGVGDATAHSFYFNPTATVDLGGH
jgi:alpha-tubulin suppressor-like RCC1 family protein